MSSSNKIIAEEEWRLAARPSITVKIISLADHGNTVIFSTSLGDIITMNILNFRELYFKESLCEVLD